MQAVANVTSRVQDTIKNLLVKQIASRMGGKCVIHDPKWCK